MKAVKYAAAIIFLFCVTTIAQNTDYSKEPGYIDFEKALNFKFTNSITEVYLEEPMLKIIAKMAQSEKEGISSALAALKLVRVNEFMTDKKDSAKIESEFESMNKQLQALKWSRIIKSQRHGNIANIYVKEGASGEYLGLFLMALDKNGKATFVNIIGKIDFEIFGKISGRLGIPNTGDKK